MRNTLKVLRKTLVMFLLVAFVQTFASSLAFASSYAVTALDTIIGSPTYYSVGGVDSYTLLLQTPDYSLISLPDLDINKVPADYLTSTGSYTLFLQSYLNGNKLVRLAMSEFEVRPQVLSSKLLFASSFGIGADDLAATDRFKFLSLPEEAQVGQTVNFTLSALDDNQEADPDYLGEVHFSVSTDSEATLPDDYQFTVEDAGTHVFSALTSFATAGDHLIQVHDTADDTLVGQLSIKVVGSDSDPGEQDGVMEITSPVAGTTDSNIITFSGTVDPGLQVEVYADGELTIYDNADSEGKFSINTPVLGDGDYSFVIKTSTATSDPIEVTIATDKPSLLTNATFSNEDPGPGEEFTVEVSFVDSIFGAKLLLDEVYTEVIQADIMAKKFVGHLVAPELPGEYPIDLLIVDPQGNEELVEDLAILTIESDSHGSADGDTDSDTDDTSTFFVPSQVKDLVAAPLDKAMTLSWSASSDNSAIDHYLIKYGLDKNNLELSVETNSDEVVWYIPDLINGSQYYFVVYGVDDEGNLGDLPSTQVVSIPGVAGQTTSHGVNEGQVLVESTSETGPEVWLVLFLSGALAFKFKPQISREQ